VNSDRPELFRHAHYAAREKYRADYALLAKALVDAIAFTTHLDVGCGQGLLIEPLQRAHAKNVRGIEYSRESQPFVPSLLRNRIIYGSLLDMPSPGSFDLVSCVEVLEHLPRNRADDAVRFLASSATKWLYVAAAIPNQPGVGHINCQPTTYWLRKFAAAGWELDLDRTGRLIDRLDSVEHCHWLPQNALILRPRLR
jgi:SAM-dependent methyltransferase